MKALSIREPYAAAIIAGGKTVEFRTWSPGKTTEMLIICSSAYKSPEIGKYLPSGIAMCIATISAVTSEEDEDGVYFAWQLTDIKPVKPFKVKGKLHFFDMPDDQIELLPGISPEKYFADLAECGIIEPMPPGLLDELSDQSIFM